MNFTTEELELIRRALISFASLQPKSKATQAYTCEKLAERIKIERSANYGKTN